MKYSVSVVVVTRNRPALLAALLGDVREQTQPPSRIVVVDDSSDAVDWASRFPDLPMEVIRPPLRVFISAAKNLGWVRCDSEYVAFIDDDNRIPRDLLAHLASDLSEHSNWGAVMPGVLYDRRPDLVWVYATPFRPDRWGFTLIGRDRVRDPSWENRILPTDALPNLSMIRREALRRVGGFDERFPVNSSADMCQRVKRTGAEVWADTGVLTRHNVDPPGVPGYWAEHTVNDPERARYEVADWFRFHRRWNGNVSMFGLRASYHSLGFLIPQLIAGGFRRGGRPFVLLAALIAGWRDGLLSRVGEGPAPIGG